MAETPASSPTGFIGKLAKFYGEHLFVQVAFLALFSTTMAMTAITSYVAKSAFLGKTQSVDALAAYALNSSVLNFSGMLVIYLASGGAAKVSKYIGEKNLVAAGVQIKTMLVFGVVFGFVLTGLLAALREPLFALFDPTDAVKEHAVVYYRNAIFCMPFMVTLFLLGSSLNGMQKAGIHMLLSIVTASLDVTGAYLVMAVWNLGFEGYAWSWVITRIIGCIMSSLVVFTPSNIREMQLFKWNFTLAAFKDLLADNGFLLGRGMLLTVVNFGNPIVSSRMSTSTFAAFGTLQATATTSSLIGDMIGFPCNLLGSKLLGEGKHSQYRRLLTRLPFVGIGISAAFVGLIILGQKSVVSLLSNDPVVTELATSAYWAALAYIPVTFMAGLLDGLIMAKQKFKFLFFSMLGAICLVYLPGIISTDLHFKTLLALWLATVIFETGRLVPSVVITLTFLRDHTPDTPPSGTIPSETESLINSTTEEEDPKEQPIKSFV